MSKSYKKSPCYKDGNKWGKKFANRRIRRLKNEDIPNGSMYKRFYEQYNISDYKFYTTWNEFLLMKNNSCWYNNDRPLTEEEIKKLFNDWNKYYRRK